MIPIPIQSHHFENDFNPDQIISRSKIPINTKDQKATKYEFEAMKVNFKRKCYERGNILTNNYQKQVTNNFIPNENKHWLQVKDWDWDWCFAEMIAIKIPIL